MASFLLRGVALGAVFLGVSAFSPAFAAADDPVVAVVNGSEIHQSDVKAVRDSLGQIPPNMSQDEVTRRIIDQIITVRLLAQEADKTGVTKDPAFKKVLEESRESQAAQFYLRQNVEKKITDKAVHDLYDKSVSAAKPQEEIKARHILVETEQEAKDIAQQLKTGKDFAELAKAKSKDPGSGKNGGDLGWFTADVMVPEFSKAAFALKQNEISAPVKSQFGWHIIQLQDRRKQQPPKFDEVKDKLREQLNQQAVSETIDRLKKAAKIDMKGAAAQPKLVPNQ